MNNVITNAEVFYKNFKALPKKNRKEFIKILLTDKEFEEDLTDIAIINQRINEPSISLEEYLSKRKSFRHEI